MSVYTRSRNILRKPAFVLALLSIPAFAWGQHEKESKESHPPAQHASKPPSRPSNPNHGAAPNRPSSRPSQGNANSARPGGNQGSRPSNPNPNSRPSNGPGNRPGNTSGNRPGNGSGNRPDNMSGNRGGNRAGNPGGNNRGGNFAGNRAAVAPGRTVSLRGGGSASIRPNGQIRSINRNGMQINRNISGGRTIVTQRNGVRTVSYGRGNGYVQRAYVVRGGHSYYQRTFYDHGVYRVGIYRGYYYGGYHYYGYYPGYWYHPAFYGWAYRPWGFGISFGIGVGGWGWGGSPWYGYYGGYFAPYPVYPSAAFWLTDYLIAANLQAAYANQVSDNPGGGGGYDQGAANYSDNGGQASSGGSNSEPVTLTPEVKQAIAEEVKAQLQAEQQQSPDGAANDGSSSAQPPSGPPMGAPSADGEAPGATPADNQVPPALDPARRTFVVSSDLTVVSDGQECALTPGDVITRLTDTPDADQNVTASVSASKKSDCAAGKQIAVSVDALQEMHNHFQEQLDAGMKALAEKQGTGGLPKAPDTTTTASDVPVPQPDKDAAKDLSDQEAAADQTETQVKQETAAQGPGGQ